METASSPSSLKRKFNAAPSTASLTAICTSREDTEDAESSPCLKVADNEKQTGEVDDSNLESEETASSSLKRKLSFTAPSTALSTTTHTSSEDTEDSKSTPCLKVADNEKQTEEEEGLDELFLCPNSREKVEPEPQKESEDDNKKQTGETVLAELVFDVNSGEKIEPELEKETGIDHQVDLDWEIDDEISASYEEHLMDDENEEDPAHSDIKLDYDSDIEPEDTDEFTKQRLQTKKDRYVERRHLAPGHPANSGPNKKFIEDFVKMVIRYSKTKNEKSSTISLSTALLFRHPDSFLMYQIRSDPTFSLDKLICFKDEINLVELSDPSPWIDEIGGDSGKLNPIRRKEMYKAFKRLIVFLLKQLGQTKFATDLLSLLRRDKIKSNLKEISEEINASKTWALLQSLIDQDFKEVAQAKKVVNPDEAFNAAQGNKVYFSSKEFKTRLDKCQQIYDRCMEKQTNNSPKEHDTVGQFSRHLLNMTDRNRAGGYSFRQSHYASRKAVWFPPDHNKNKFDGIPKNWNMHLKPADGRQPDAWTIDLSGSSEVVKMGEDVHITILRMADDWCQKFRDLQRLKWKNIRDDEYFFLNSKRKKFGPLQNTSMLREYARVTGTSKATTNTFRKAMEPAIQSNEAMKTRSKVISSHSVATGAKFYDSSAPAFRASALHFMNDGEIEYETSEVPESVAAKRLKLDEEGQKYNQEKAQERIQKDPSKRNATLGKNCKVTPSARVWMQKAFSKDGVFSGLDLFKSKFPGKFL